MSQFAIDAKAAGLDRHFGNGGRVVHDFGSDDEVDAVTMGHNGKVLLAGSISVRRRGKDTERIFVTRLKPNGAIDRSFGHEGRTILPTRASTQSRDELPVAIAVLSRGKIVVVGSATYSRSEAGTYHSDLILARLRSNGQMDRSLSADGVRIVRSPGELQATAAEADIGRTRIAVTAGLRDSTGDPVGNAVVQLTGEGEPLPGFGDRGWVTEESEVSFAGAVALLPGGRMAAAVDLGFAIGMYTADGELDSGFGDGGVATISWGQDSRLEGLVADGEGRLLMTGPVGERIGLARLRSDGGPDPSLSDDGRALTGLGSGATETLTLEGTLGLDPQGRIILAGQRNVGDRFLQQYALRFKPDGEPQNFPGPNRFPLGYNAFVNANALGPGGRLVAVGQLLRRSGESDSAVFAVRLAGR